MDKVGASKRIVIAGGGTGGHLFPGVAIAEAFRLVEQSEILFVGTGKALEKSVLAEHGIPCGTIRTEGFKGKGLVKTLRALLMLPVSLWESYRILRNFHPRLVIGVGGYASGPVVLAAHLMGIRTAIAEQNAFPGLTNRILGRIADRIFLTFRETRAAFPDQKAVVTGNPVRRAFLEAAVAHEEKGESFTILVFGGSQGARFINRLILAAIPHLKIREMKLRFHHQGGTGDQSYLEEMYLIYGVHARVTPFIEDMAAAYREADLVVCRSGATSVAEITVMGKAAILIPFPYAADDHQKKNAEILADAGAAVLMEQEVADGRMMAEYIERFYYNRDLLRDMERKAKSLGKVNAAARIVAESLALLRG